MTDSTASPTHVAPRRPVREFFAHLMHMPRSHKFVLTLAAILAGSGLFGQLAGRISGQPSAAVSSSPTPPGASRAFDPSPAAPPAPSPTMTEKLSPWASRVGLALLGGFVIGWAFRAFLKLMATVTFVGAAIFVALSYFNFVNIDFSEAKTKFNSSTEWLTDQASRAKDAALSHLPGSFSSFLGMFLGFRRK